MRSIGVDVGGTETKISVIDEKLRVLFNNKIPTPLNDGYDGFVKVLSNFLKGLINQYNANKICIAIAGDVDSEKGILRFAPNLCRWKNKKIKDDFQKETSVEVFVENDANMAIWGAYVFELKKRYSNVVGFTLGTGVGGGIIINGKLYKGTTTTAGEFGHIVIRVGGKKCACGNYGCLEAYCSTRYLIYEAKRRIKFLKDKNEFTPKSLFELAKKGDEKALEIWYEYGINLGYGIGNIIVSFNPQVIVLTGGVSNAHRFFMKGIKDTLKNYGIKKPIEDIKIHVTSTKNLGVLGCAEFVMEKR